jgi:hypothetical protein
MVYFQTENPNLDESWKVLQRQIMVVFMGILSILGSNGIFYSHLVHLVVIWYIFSHPFWYIVPKKIWQACSPPKVAFSEPTIIQIYQPESQRPSERDNSSSEIRQALIKTQVVGWPSRVRMRFAIFLH